MENCPVKIIQVKTENLPAHIQTTLGSRNCQQISGEGCLLNLIRQEALPAILPPIDQDPVLSTIASQCLRRRILL